MKYAVPDNVNIIGLKISPKNQLLQAGRDQIFSISIKTNEKPTEKWKKKLLLFFVQVYLYNGCIISKVVGK